MKYFCIRCILPFNTCNNCEVEIIISYLYLRTLEIREINNLPVSTQQVSVKAQFLDARSLLLSNNSA